MFDQNRFLVGFGLNYNNTIRLELGYMNQIFFKSPDTEGGLSRMNHTIRITLTTDLPFKRKEHVKHTILFKLEYLFTRHSI